MSANAIYAEVCLEKTAKAVIFYDHLETMLVANQVLEQLPHSRNGCTEWIINSWRFDLLEEGHEAGTALNECLDADLMIVALGDASAFYKWPKEWLAHWGRSHLNKASSLVLVIVGTANRPEAWPAVIAPLIQLAESSRLQFLLVDDARTSPAFHALTGLPPRALSPESFRGSRTLTEALVQSLEKSPRIQRAAALTGNYER